MKLEEVNTRTKEAVDFLVAALESGHSEVLTAYLGAMAKFHSYTFGNIMLIARQKPDATNVAGLRTWNSLGRFVKRGEKGIFILAPMVGRRSAKGQVGGFQIFGWRYFGECLCQSLERFACTARSRERTQGLVSPSLCGGR